MKKLLSIIALSSIFLSHLAWSNPKDSTAKKQAATTIAKGNGIIIDSAATDMYYASSGKGHPPSLLSQLSTRSTGIKYIFPDYGYIDFTYLTKKTKSQPPVIKLTDPSANLISCSDTKLDFAFQYTAMPQVKPMFQSVLGTCQNGTAVTAYYANGGKYKVLPMVSYAYLDPDYKSQFNTAYFQKLATNIATIINNDPNAAGVSFDNEPAITKTFSQDLATTFFTTLAQQLSTKGKLLAIFDGNSQIMNSISNQYHNVIDMHSLYDLGAFPGYTNTDKAIPLNDYSGHKGYASEVKSYANAYFGGYEKSLPVMFVAAASASSTMWNSIQIYNTNFPKKGLNPYPGKTPSACRNNNGLPEYDLSFFTNFLCTSATSCTNTQAASKAFISACDSYSNPQTTTSGSAVTMSDYLSAALNGVKYALQNNNNPSNYIGVTYYTYKVPSFNDVGCAVHYYSIEYTPSLNKRCLQYVPATFVPSVWTTISSWADWDMSKPQQQSKTKK